VDYAVKNLSKTSQKAFDLKTALKKINNLI